MSHTLPIAPSCAREIPVDLLTALDLIGLGMLAGMGLMIATYRRVLGKAA